MNPRSSNQVVHVHWTHGPLPSCMVGPQLGARGRKGIDQKAANPYKEVDGQATRHELEDTEIKT